MTHSATKPYAPQTHSLPGRLVKFFSANLEEELSADDITLKFDVQRNKLHSNLQLAVEHNWLARDGSIYSAGSQIRDKALVVPLTPSDFPRIESRKAKVHCLHMLDVESLRVETGVPYMKRASKGDHKWEPLFAKLTKPDQSIAVPAKVKGALAAAVAKRNKQKRGTFAIALTSADQARVWRLA
jgi:hypothetical protein